MALQAPINYMTDVQSPLQRAMAGYQAGRQEVRQDQEQARADERLSMDQGRYEMDQQRFAMQQQQLKAQQASASEAASKKAAFNSDLGAVVNGTMSRKELIAKYPEFSGAMKATFDMVPDEQKEARFTFGKQLQAAIKNDSLEMAATLMEREIEAAKNTPGQENYVATLEQSKNILNANPRLAFELIGASLDVSGEAGLTMEPTGQSVQSSVSVGNGRLIVQTMKNGETRVIDAATNTQLTGEVAAQAIQAAEAAAAQARGDITAAELTAKARLGGEVEAAKTGGALSQNLSVDAFNSLNKVRTNILNLGEVNRLIDEGADTGRIAELFPDWNAATVELRNMQNQLGLDVVGSVTFGALSKDELALALSTGLPTNLDQPKLKQWVSRKINAQEKLAEYLEKQATFLSDPKNNLNDWMKVIKTGSQGQQGSDKVSLSFEEFLKDPRVAGVENPRAVYENYLRIVGKQ